jgi:hypothetical protein
MLASLTNDAGAALANPVTTDIDGNFYFNAGDGVYSLAFIVGGKVVYREDGVLVGPAGADPTALIVELRTSVPQASASAAQATASAGIASVFAAAAAGHNDQAAIQYAPITETAMFVLDPTTSHANNVFVRADAATGKNFNGTLAAFIAAHGGITGPPVPFHTAKTITAQDGTTSTSTVDTPSYSYESGARALSVKGSDNLKIPAAWLPFGLAQTIVLDMVVPASAGGTLLEMGDGSNVAAVYISGTDLILQVANPSITSGTTNVTLGVVPAAGTRLQIALRLESGIASASINGEPARRISNHSASTTPAYATPTSFTPTYLNIANTTTAWQVGLVRMVFRTMADAEFQSWGRTWRPVVKASRLLGQFNDTFGTDGGGRYREVAIVLVDDGAKSGQAAAVVTSGHRYEGAGSVPGETPAKIVGWVVSHAKDSGIITRGAPFDLYVPQYWSSGKGHSLGFVGGKGKVGLNKGKTFAWVHDYLGNISGSTAGDTSTLNGSLRYYESTKNFEGIDPAATGASWSTVLQAGIGNYCIPGPGSLLIELPESHVHAGRVGFAYYTSAGIFCRYRDPDGTQGSSTIATGTPATYAPVEPNAVMLPNGDILVIARMQVSGADAQNVRGIYRSTAATAFQSLVFEHMLVAGDGFAGAAVGSGAFQLDPDGHFGALGRIGLVNALYIGVPVRSGCRLSFLEDTNYAVRDSQDLILQEQISAYCSAAPIFGGSALLLVNETSLDGSVNNRDCTYVSVAVPAPRGNAL